MPIKDYFGDMVGLGISAGLAYSFYTFAKAGREMVHNLKNVPELEINANLVSKLSESGGGVLACVRGVVKASDVAIRCVARPEVAGVIWRHTIQEHLVAQVMGFWMNDKRTVDSSTSSVPFMLMDKGIGVQISDPAKLEDVDLILVSDKFGVANNSLADHLWGWMKGIRSTGTQQTEEMLVEGTQAMGIGQLTLKNEAIYLDHSPLVPYMVTTRSKQAIVEELDGPVPYLRVLSVITACGVAFYSYRILKRWYRSWRKDIRRRDEQRVLDEARARREAQGNDLPESLMCVVCCGLRDVLLVPCRHVCVCSECALKLNPRVCPVCRTEIERIQPVFYS
ncbi:mitochondrial E3 ubiquitin protein ligase 1 [Penaeus vannamei]|uniref:mitochondrial E3 ubiquitin protein ligase 1 n=1 Tax=Penaeus vannamei TaxID=6689 RepID=UPI000F670198|nr:mitochondrial E3 ubiquitin protein ligase 1-like [Penaeus vannamei]